MFATSLLLALVPLAWLLPNHYAPWVSAWQDGMALLLLCAAVACMAQAGRMARSWAAFCALALLVIAMQAGTGRIFFAGDAWMAMVYVLAFALALLMGPALAGGPQAGDTRGLQALSIGVVVGGVLSVGIALVQWTGAVSPGLWMVDMSLQRRPFGNVAQPNHLSTIAFLAMCSLAVLRQTGRIGAPAFWLGAAWMLLGMAMSESRTGWVQLGVMMLMVLALTRRTGQVVAPRGLAALLAAFAVVAYFWSAICDALLLSAGLPRDAVLEGGGSRSRHWGAMLDAIGREPLWGYGWQQVSVANVRVADSRPFVGESIASSHNILLDLLVWNGIPVGAVFVGLALWWFVSRLMRCRDQVSMWLLAAVAGLAVHAMLEAPLEYAYFLIPLGLWLGAIDALQTTPRRWLLPRWPLRGAAVLLGLGVLVISVDYLKAEEGHRLLRLESARIGVSGISTPPPELRVLDQLAAFQHFAQTQATPGMSAADVDWMRKVSERYAFPPMMFRYALAAGLNGRPQDAALTLVRLCRIHPKDRCTEGREAWLALQTRYPQLAPMPP